jgi:competence protein ComEA
MVHVAGAVQQPGVYEMAAGARGIDAVDAAGGMTKNAAADAINLAEVLTDGQQLRIPTTKEVAVNEAPAVGSLPQNALSTGTAATSTINLNTADSAALQTLPGVGPVTADKIIAEREAHGAFKSLDDLMRVSGIGEKRVEALQGLADVK